MASTADSAQFWQIGQSWLCYVACPFHTLFARISCNTFLESLNHTGETCVVFMSGVWKFIKINLRALCSVIRGHNKKHITFLFLTLIKQAFLVDPKTYRGLNQPIIFFELLRPNFYAASPNMVSNETWHLFTTLETLSNILWTVIFS